MTNLAFGLSQRYAAQLYLPKTLSGLEHSFLESSVKCTLCCWVWKLTEHRSGGDYRVSRDQALFRTSRDLAFLAIISRRAYLLALAMRSAYIGGEDRLLAGWR